MPPTQEMLDLGLVAAMQSNNIVLVETSNGHNVRKFEKSVRKFEESFRKFESSFRNFDGSFRKFEEASELNLLQNTSIDDFLENFRENASEFLVTAYL